MPWNGRGGYGCGWTWRDRILVGELRAIGLALAVVMQRAVSSIHWSAGRLDRGQRGREGMKAVVGRAECAIGACGTQCTGTRGCSHGSAISRVAVHGLGICRKRGCSTLVTVAIVPLLVVHRVLW